MGTTLQTLPSLAQESNTTRNMTTTEEMVGTTYGGGDIDSSTSTINCEGEVKGPGRALGIQADAFVRHGICRGTGTSLTRIKTGKTREAQ